MKHVKVDNFQFSTFNFQLMTKTFALRLSTFAFLFRLPPSDFRLYHCSWYPNRRIIRSWLRQSLRTLTERSR